MSEVTSKDHMSEVTYKRSHERSYLQKITWAKLLTKDHMNEVTHIVMMGATTSRSAINTPIKDMKQV